METVKEPDATGESVENTSEQKLPIEPELIWVESEGKTYNAGDAFGNLRGFHINGNRKGKSEASRRGGPPTPALLHRYRDLNKTRYEYPVCLNGKETHSKWAIPLTAVIDDVVEKVTDQTDTGERHRRHIYRVEAAIRELAERERESRLDVLWDRAAAKVLKSPSLSPEQRELLEQNIKSARSALKSEAVVVRCDREAPLKLFTATMESYWQEQSAGWATELESLIKTLEDYLAVDFSQSTAASSPDHLRDSVGTITDDVDFDMMSEIMTQKPHGDRLPEARRKRLCEALSVLHRMMSIFQQESTPDGPLELPFYMGAVTGSCAEAIERLETRRRFIVDFFRAVQIARLESGNHYRESVHDPYFAAFGEDHLTDEERALCPPVLLSLVGGDVTAAEVSRLLEVLDSTMPIKVLVRIEDVPVPGRASGSLATSSGPVARLAPMTMATGHAFAMQAPVSRLSLMQDGFLDGFRFRGPALFSVFIGRDRNVTSMGAYLDSASATDARMFPVFTFDPNKGPALADRLRIEDNAECQSDWPAENYSYTTADGVEETTTLSFTAAEYLYLDKRFDRHFWVVPAEAWHPDMVPLHEFVILDTAGRQGKIPFITTVDSRNRLGRVVVTGTIVDAVEATMAAWRHFQELGGVNNSFAERLLAEERSRLDEEKKQEVLEIERNYIAQLDQDVGELTREIVNRIAGQLMLDSGAQGYQPIAPVSSRAVPETASPGPASSPATESSTTEAIAQDEDEEEVVVLDDAYIDTPLCTSCDECTKLDSAIFAYNENKQAYIKDDRGGPYSNIVRAAELCPVRLIHPGKPKNPDEPDLAKWTERAKPFM